MVGSHGLGVDGAERAVSKEGTLSEGRREERGERAVSKVRDMAKPKGERVHRKKAE